MKRKAIGEMDLYEDSWIPEPPPSPAPGSFGEWVPVIALLAFYAFLFLYPWGG